MRLIQIVTRQLGRNPSIGFKVALECPFGRPAVLINEPFSLEGAPNPNLYYLSCPYLRRNLSRLEDSGFIARLQKMLMADEDLAALVKKAQDEHRRQWLTAAEAHQKAVGEGGRSGGATTGEFHAPNIASTKDDLKIKCLHAHIAWFLVHPEYLLGQIIMKEVEPAWCENDTCEVLLRD